MGNRGNEHHGDHGNDGEAVLVGINDAGEAELRLRGGAPVRLMLTPEQVSTYRTAQLAERARAGTLLAEAAGWPAAGSGEENDLLIGDRNWFYC